MKFLVVFALALATSSAFETAVPFRDVPFNAENTGRIINGKEVAPGQIPYQVGLSMNGAFCGGSLIGSTWILTAAHCVSGFKGTGNAYLGSTDVMKGTVRNFPASDVFVHQNYNAVVIVNDIALIKIAAVSMSSTINIVKLPEISSSYSTYVGDVATMSGWGKTSDASSTVASKLMTATATVISNPKCQETYGTISVGAGTMCVTTAGGSSTCNGDSGGPLTAGGTQVGVVSFGSSSGCAKGFPAAFTRVTHYRTWIKSISGI